MLFIYFLFIFKICNSNKTNFIGIAYFAQSYTQKPILARKYVIILLKKNLELRPASDILLCEDAELTFPVYDGGKTLPFIMYEDKNNRSDDSRLFFNTDIVLCRRECFTLCIILPVFRIFVMSLSAP